jgi:coenzyme F420-reducing hydrogenase beta subunit
MVSDGEGFLYPRIDEQACSNCGACEKVCPMLAHLPQGEPPAAFAAWHLDDDVREESSSGGVFSALMKKTLQDGGAVVGAAFDETMTLRHQSAQSEVDGEKFRGSKYLQSIIGDSYREVRSFLQQGRRVLFSGTPCQVAGLYSYLGKQDDNLLTCDLVCHGVPSPKVFAAYKVTLERRHGANVSRIAFRRKDCGWKRFSVALSFDNATEYRRVFQDDPFMLGFLRDTYLRPSCHACRFSRLPRMADLSLGDLWGVGSHHPEWDDDKGTSLILVQSARGQVAFDACRESLVVHETDLELCIRSNPCISGSVPKGKNRAAFFADLNRIPFEKLMKKYMAPRPLWRKLFGRAKAFARARLAS